MHQKNYITYETCVVMQTKTMSLRSCHNKQKSRLTCETYVVTQIKIITIRSHTMKPLKTNLRFNGEKIFHISNKNLLYMNGYTYVVDLDSGQEMKKTII